MAEPAQTYWEKRCLISENVLSALIDIVGNALPHTQNYLVRLCDNWQDELDKLDNHCDHEWVSADNQIVTGAEICTKCMTIRPASADD